MSDGLKDALKGCNVKSSYITTDKVEDATVSVMSSQGKTTLIFDKPIVNTIEFRGVQEPLAEGTKYDQGKPRHDLLPTSLMHGVAEILTFGAKKYAEHNWRKGIAYSRIYSSLQRHITSWQSGETIDPESGKPHLWHAGCNIAFLIEFESKPEQYKSFDDRYKGDK